MWVTYDPGRVSLRPSRCAHGLICPARRLDRLSGDRVQKHARRPTLLRAAAPGGAVSVLQICTVNVNCAPCLRVSSTGFLHNCFRFLLRVYFNKSSTGNLHVYLLLKIAEYQKPRSSHSRRAGYECRTNSPNKIQSTSNQKRTPNDSLSATFAGPPGWILNYGKWRSKPVSRANG